MNSNLIINNNIQVNNNNNIYLSDSKMGDETFIEKSNIEDKPFENENSESNENSNNNDVIFSISHLDIQNNDLVIEKENLQTDGSLIMKSSELDKKNKKNKDNTTKKLLKIVVGFLCFVLIFIIMYTFYYALS